MQVRAGRENTTEHVGVVLGNHRGTAIVGIERLSAASHKMVPEDIVGPLAIRGPMAREGIMRLRYCNTSGL